MQASESVVKESPTAEEEHHLESEKEILKPPPIDLSGGKNLTHEPVEICEKFQPHLGYNSGHTYSAGHTYHSQGGPSDYTYGTPVRHPTNYQTLHQPLQLQAYAQPPPPYPLQPLSQNIEMLKNNINDPPKNMYTLPPKLPPEYNAALKSIMLEHCYARPYNWRPEANFLRPTKTVFITQTISNRRKSNNPLAPAQDPHDLINVEAPPANAPLIYDITKASKLMEECEKHAFTVRDDQNIEDWEDKVSRINWNSNQTHVFSVMVNILNSDRMSRLAYIGSHNEPVLRRTVIEKSVKRFRQLMAKYSWDNKLVQWLHQLLLDHLSGSYLAAYLDLLQTLKHKLPAFVEKLIFGATTQHTRVGGLSNETLFTLLKRPWDPVASSLNHDKPKKLPGNPVIIIVPNTPSTSTNTYSKRLHRWINLFTNLAHVTTVFNNIGTNGHKLTMMNCVDQMFAATRAKVQEVKAEYPNRPIILAGFNAGAALALQVAQVETVLCILCLGFSIHTAEGSRGDPDDNLLELQCPVLFVIGQCSNTALQEHMEDIRERMRVETGLLVVGAADDYLRISKKKQRSEGITQTIVDRCIVDEVGEFVSGLLLSPYPPQLRQSPAHIPPEMMKRPKVERKRNNSNGSSLDSEPPSPTPRISRPGQTLSPVLGRPPGSKSKSKIEAKWHAMQQGIPNSSSNNSLNIPASPSSTTSQSSTPNTPDSTTTDADLLDTPQSSKISSLSSLLSSTSTYNTTPMNQSQAKLQALGIPPGRGVYHGSTLSSLLQGGVRTLPPNPSKLKDTLLGKMPGMPIQSRLDISKMTVLNNTTPKGPHHSSNYSNMMLMPDGKIKTCPPAVRGPINSSMLYPKGKPPNTTNLTTQLNTPTSTKYITSKKQLLANKNRLVKKMPYLPSTSHLPPPTNLTSQDIMDLPIIFADDNQMLANNTMQPSDTPSSQILPQMKPNSSGKLLFLNKPSPAYNQNVLKRSLPAPKPNPIKYAKIILSKAPPTDEHKKSPKINLPPGITLKEIEQPTAVPMDVDLENELVATAITKPNFMTTMSDKLIYKKSEIGKILTTDATTSRKMDLDFDDDSDDPEYHPSRSDL